MVCAKLHCIHIHQLDGKMKEAFRYLTLYHLPVSVLTCTSGNGKQTPYKHKTMK